MAGAKFKYGIHKITDKPVYIRDAENGLACNCKCANDECNETLVAAQGPENEWHFRHYDKTNCNGGQETAIHKLAKEILITNSQVLIPGKTLQYSKPRKEEVFGSIKPDVTVEWDAQNVFIEIFVRNKKGRTHLDYYKTNQLKSFEVNLSKVSYDITPEDLQELVLNIPSNKTVIFWETPSVISSPAPELITKREKQWWERPGFIIAWIVAAGVILYKAYKCLTKKNLRRRKRRFR